MTITGAGLTGATAVSFGSSPAASFTVNSDSSITAIAALGTGVASVTVTTPAGTTPATAGSLFTATDANLEGDMGSWRSASRLSASALYAKIGVSSLQLSPSNDGKRSAATSLYAVLSRAFVTATEWVLTPRQQNQVRAFVAFYDSNGSLIALNSGPVVSTLKGVWTLVSQTATSPAGTVSAALGFQDVSGNEAVYLDNAACLAQTNTRTGVSQPPSLRRADHLSLQLGDRVLTQRSIYRSVTRSQS